MTPKEKAEKLFVRFNKEGLHQISSEVNRFVRKEMIKQCALIAVKEIEEALQEYDERNDTFELQNMDGDFRYWQKVKEEIEKL